jgi:hypothetical protein
VRPLLNIPMPERIKALPVHPNGYPIPFFVHQPKGKLVDLRIASPYAIASCHRDRVCWICGQKLGKFVCFIGGPLSTNNQVYNDGPMHRNCAEYALKVCPYLAISQVDRRGEAVPGYAVHDFQIKEKPERFGLLITNGWTIFKAETIYLFHAFNPIEMTWWKDGKQL